MKVPELISLKLYEQNDFDPKKQPVSWSGRCSNGAGGIACAERSDFTVLCTSGKWALCAEHTVPLLRAVAAYNGARVEVDA